MLMIAGEPMMKYVQRRPRRDGHRTDPQARKPAKPKVKLSELRRVKRLRM